MTETKKEEPKHPREQDKKGDHAPTGAGQEATNNAPSDHSEEHQSNYGGGSERRSERRRVQELTLCHPERSEGPCPSESLLPRQGPSLRSG